MLLPVILRHAFDCHIFPTMLKFMYLPVCLVCEFVTPQFPNIFGEQPQSSLCLTVTGDRYYSFLKLLLHQFAMTPIWCHLIPNNTLSCVLFFFLCTYSVLQGRLSAHCKARVMCYYFCVALNPKHIKGPSISCVLSHMSLVTLMDGYWIKFLIFFFFLLF